MPLERRFFAQETPPLDQVVDFLARRRSDEPLIDCGDLTVVLPTAHARARLLSKLAEAPRTHGRPLLPPDVVTVGELPERLYDPQLPAAAELLEQLAWMEALRSRRLSLERILASPPEPDDTAGWMQLARMFWERQRNLAAHGHGLADVVEQVKGLRVGAEETRRWEWIAEVAGLARDRLARGGLASRDGNRLDALARGACRLERDLMLVAVADLPPVVAEMIEKAAAAAPERIVTILTLGDPRWADRFDPWGTIRPESWQRLPVSLDESRMHVVGGFDDQAEQVVECLDRLGRQLGPELHARQVVVGLPDPDLQPHLERALASRGVAARTAPGRPVSESAPVRLLREIAAWVETRRTNHLAALLRQSDLESWLRANGVSHSPLGDLDDYRNTHFPSRLTGKLRGREDEFPNLRRALEQLNELLQPLAGPPKTLPRWGLLLRRTFRKIYSLKRPRTGEATAARMEAVFRAIDQILTELEEAPAELSPKLPLGQVVDLFVDAAADRRAAAAPQDDALELCGWLDLPLEDASAAIVTQMVEGIVPASVGADGLLPQRLRKKLGMDANERRFARDCYLLSVLAWQKSELDLIVGRFDADGNPRQPSRLLLGKSGDLLVRRCRKLFAPPQTWRRAEIPVASGGPWRSLEIPRPAPLDTPVARMSVTSFRTYLACPYRYYLRHVLRLSAVADDAMELGADTFGSLLHDVLEQFGKDAKARRLADEAAIRDWLRETLRRFSQARFGDAVLPAVKLQVQQLELRLDAFAREQALLAQEGWEIAYTETSAKPEEPPTLVVDGQAMELSGRIDRIDWHPERETWRVLDYKSSARGNPPEATHRQKEQWVDLQLPLYRHLVRRWGLAGRIELGYFTLPDDVNGVGVQLAEWSDPELESADQVACDVIRAVREEKFWPPADPPPKYADEFAAICQEGVYVES